MSLPPSSYLTAWLLTVIGNYPGSLGPRVHSVDASQSTPPSAGHLWELGEHTLLLQPPRSLFASWTPSRAQS